MPPDQTTKDMTAKDIKRKISNLKRRTNLSRTQLLVFVLIFAAIGGYVLYRSLAAAPLVASLEAEQTILPAGGLVISDSTASAGQAVKLSSNGTASGSVSFPSSVSSLSVIARGDSCQGSSTMTVSLDNASLLVNASVSATSWTTYNFTPTSAWSSGSHDLAISFNNAYSYSKRHGHGSTNCSRALYVDLTNFYGPAPPPPPAPTVTLSASPATVSAGAASTLTWNSTNANACTASGAWSGTEPTSGSASTGAINQNSTYSLTCTGSGGSATASATVTVNPVSGGGGTPSGYYWLGDFHNGAQDFSAFDTHDANLGTTINDPFVGLTLGSTILSQQPTNYSGSSYSSREIASNSLSSTSVSGPITVLWQPGNYSNSWMQQGSDVWFRTMFLLPDGTNPNYPGKITPVAGDGVSSPWHVILEWHINDSYFDTHGGNKPQTSTKLEIGYDAVKGYGPALLYKPVGGTVGNTQYWYFWETDQVETKTNNLSPLGNVQPLKYNHWYNVLIHMTLNSNPSLGYTEWYVDGNLRFADHLSTLTQAGDGTTPGIAYEAGLYRASIDTSSNETVYVGPMVAGPTRTSVGD